MMMDRKTKCVYAGLVVVIMLALSAGCVNTSKPLTESESTIYIASVGGMNETFTLWEHEPGCCKEIAFYMKEPDGAVTIQSVPVDQSKIYHDASWSDARIVVMDERGGYLSLREPWTKMDLIGWNSYAVYKFHVPKGTVIRPYGSPGNRRSDDDDTDMAAAYYTLYMSPASPMSPIYNSGMGY